MRATDRVQGGVDELSTGLALASDRLASMGVLNLDRNLALRQLRDAHALQGELRRRGDDRAALGEELEALRAGQGAGAAVIDGQGASTALERQLKEAAEKLDSLADGTPVGCSFWFSFIKVVNK